MNHRRIVMYVALAYGLAWAGWFLVTYPLYHAQGSFTVPIQLTVAAGMFAPALAALLTRVITREGLKDARIVPTNFRRHWRIYVLAWFGPLALVLAGAALYYLTHPADFDPTMGFLRRQVLETAELTGQDVAVDDASMRTMLLATIAALPFAPLMNAIPCFGEEWGWRGYLLPKLLERHSMTQTLLISGVIWGLWHAPITALGHNYGLDYPGYPLTGIASMCVLCIVLGVFMSYVTLYSGSCLPAVLAHGMFNGCAGLGPMLSATGGNPFVGPTPTGIVGGAFLILTAIVMARRLIRDEEGLRLTLEAPASTSTPGVNANANRTRTREGHNAHTG